MSGINFDSGFENKIQRAKELDEQEKITLGKKLSNLEKESVAKLFKSFVSRLSRNMRKTYFIERAEKYVQQRRKLQIEHLKSNIKNHGIDGKYGINRLLNVLETLRKNLEKETLTEEDRKKQNNAFEKNFLKLAKKLLDLREKENKETRSTDTTATKLTEIFSDVISEPVLKEIKEIEKKEEEEVKKAQMQSLFRLNVVPTAPDKPVTIHGKVFQPEAMIFIYGETNSYKKELMEKHLPLDKVSDIVAQARKYPIMQAAVEKIRQNLEKWDDLTLFFDQTALTQLKGKLEQQMQNLGTLSDIISDVIQTTEDAGALITLSPNERIVIGQHEGEEIALELTDFLNHFLENKVTKSNVNEVVKALQLKISSLKVDFPKPTTQELAERRGKAPVTTTAIRLQAELYHAIIKGKMWASVQREIKTHGCSRNEVFKLYHPATSSKEKFPAFEAKPGGGAVAFFKVGDKGEEAVGAMETLAWRFAVMMGLEGLLVPTKETEVRVASELSGSTEKVKQRFAKGKLVKKIEEAKEPRRGGIQVAQQGQVFDDYMKDTSTGRAVISKSEITRATLASVVFGMFDAHDGNIFVTEDGKIKFFDNTRSLPNSNGFINRGNINRGDINQRDGLIFSYRCSLLNLPETREKLTTEEIDQLKQDVADYKQKIERLDKYLESRQAQGQLKKLPPGWMNVDSSIAAMKERVNLMEKALISGGVKNLQQLVISSNPAYKFAFALSYLMGVCIKAIDVNMKSDQVQKIWHSAVNGEYFNKDLMDLMLAGFDVKKIKDWCDDPRFTLDSIINKLQKYYNDMVSNPPHPDEKNRRMIAAEGIATEILKSAAVDYKDLSRGDCEKMLIKNNLLVFKKNGVTEAVKTFDEILSNVISRASKNNNDLQLVSKGADFKVIYKTPTGYRVKNVDLSKNPGKVKVGEEAIPIKEFIESLKGVTDPPTFDELPVLSPDTTTFCCNESEEGIILRKSQDNKSLVVAQRVTDQKGENKVVEYIFPPGQDGKFNVSEDQGWDYNGEFTIEEIINKLK